MKGVFGALATLAGAVVVFVDVASAAGVEGQEAPPPPVKIIVAQETVPDVGLDVQAVCQGKTVVFSFLNVGEPWPAVANIKIFRVSDQVLLFHRSMRMAKMQKASFKLPAAKNPGGEIGLFVEPSWMMRTFSVDAKATCD